MSLNIPYALYFIILHGCCTMHLAQPCTISFYLILHYFIILHSMGSQEVSIIFLLFLLFYLTLHIFVLRLLELTSSYGTPWSTRARVRVLDSRGFDLPHWDSTRRRNVNHGNDLPTGARRDFVDLALYLIWRAHQSARRSWTFVSL